MMTAAGFFFAIHRNRSNRIPGRNLVPVILIEIPFARVALFGDERREVIRPSRIAQISGGVRLQNRGPDVFTARVGGVAAVRGT